MNLKTKIWMGLVVIILAAIPTTVLFCQNQSLKEQVASYAGELDVKHKALTESLQRAETNIAKNSEELEYFAEQNGIDIDNVIDDLESINGRLEAVAVTTAKTTTVVHNHYPSDSTSPSDVEVPVCKEDGRPIDVHGYTKTTEERELTDSNGIRIADVSFSAARERPWSSKVYGLKYKILNTIGRGENDQVILTTELIVENPEGQPGENFRIEGFESRVLQAPTPGPEFDWWDPYLYLAAIPALIVHSEIDFSASLALGFSIWSYGSNWRFFGISAGYDAFQNSFRASLIPVLYNLGGPLPILSDLWIFLDVGIDTRASVSVGLGIGTTL